MPPIWSESDLLPGPDPSAPLGPFDGQAAAIIKAFLYTTPNQDQIFVPVGTRDGVYLRADLRYGPHDPTLWPQLYVPDLCHLGAIPSKPMDPANPLSIMWWNPTRGDFISSEGGLLDGLGRLSNARYTQLQTMQTKIVDRVNEYRRNNPKPNNCVLTLERTLVHACTHLGNLSTTFTQMVLGVTDFQRYYLELYGLLDYLEIYLLRIQGVLPPAAKVEKCVGAISVSPPVVQEFFIAGIPVWFVQPCRTGPFANNVRNVVTPCEPANFLCLDKHNPPFPVIYNGDSNVRDKHDAFYRFARTLSLFKDPFQDELSETTRPSTNRAGQAHPSSKPGPYQFPGRNKFVPLESRLAPFSIPVWSTALQAVDRSPSHLVSTYNGSKHFGHYAFPDPGLFITPATDERKTRAINTWLRAREAWIVRVAHEGSLAMSGQHWRDLLSTDFGEILTGDTKSATRRQRVLEFLKPKFVSNSELKMRSVLGEPLVWQRKEYLTGVLPPDDIVREILWELYELNFTYELLALDRRACKDLDLSHDSQVFERQDLISKCFPDGAFRHISIPTRNCGLAADTLQERLPYIIHLVQVMKSWKGNTPAVFPLANRLPSDLSGDQGRELEETATKYYCQQFFNYFGRAAQIPYRLFLTRY